MTPALHLVTPETAPTPVLLREETQPPTQAQRIAGERLATNAIRIGRIVGAAFLTPEAKAQATELRKECERACSELRRAGI